MRGGAFKIFDQRAERSRRPTHKKQMYSRAGAVAGCTHHTSRYKMSEAHEWLDLSVVSFQETRPVPSETGATLPDERDGKYDIAEFLRLACLHETVLMSLQPSIARADHCVLGMEQRCRHGWDGDTAFRVRYSRESVRQNFSDVMVVAQHPSWLAATAYVDFKWQEALDHTWRLLKTGWHACDQAEGQGCRNVAACLGPMRDALKLRLMDHTPLPADLCAVILDFSATPPLCTWSPEARRRFFRHLQRTKQPVATT